MRSPQSPQRGKARQSSLVPLSVKLPPQRIREKFLIVYELEGCQKAVNYLSKYYRIRRMRIILNGKRVKKEWVAWYLENQACFKRQGLNKRIVLHEFYHHLVDCSNFNLPLTKEEREARNYATAFFD